MKIIKSETTQDHNIELRDAESGGYIVQYHGNCMSGEDRFDALKKAESHYRLMLHCIRPRNVKVKFID